MAERSLTIDLSAPVSLSDVPQLAAGFFSWWRGELLALLPGGSAKAGAGEPALLYVRQDQWILKTEDRVDGVALDTQLADSALADQMLDAARGAPLAKLKIVLPREHVLLRRLELPAMSDTRLRQAVELQVDRISPFKADAVRYSHRVVGRDAERHVVAVDVAIVPAQRVKPIEERLRALGIAAGGVDVEGVDGAGEGFDLGEPLSAEQVARKRNRNLLLALGAAAIWVLAFYAWGDAGAREEAAWQTRIADLKPAAERSAALRRQIEALSAPILAANAYDPAAMLNVLAELTRVLPDTVRVVDLKVAGGRVQVSGLAQSAPPLISLLEQSPLFADVKATSAFVRRTESAKERFEISMRIEGQAP